MSIKNKINNLRAILISILTPARKNNALGLYQRTIAYSIWIVIVLSAASIILEAIQTNSHWITFFENCLIGVVCSTIVVIVTSILQFKAEQERCIRDYLSVLFEFLTLYEKCLCDESVNQRICQAIFDCYGDLLDVEFEVVWYNQKKEKQYLDLIRKTLHLETVFMSSKRGNYLDAIKEIGVEAYNDAVESAIVFSKDYELRKINRFEYLKIDLNEEEDTAGKNQVPISSDD